MVTLRRILIPGAVLALASAAEARETITAGLKAGVGLSQPFSELGTGPEFELEGGYTLPWLERRLRALLQVAYQRTGSDGSIDDARFPGERAEPAQLGGYNWELTEDELTVMPAIFGQWFAPGTSVWTPYAALGPRVYMLRSTENAKSRGTETVPSESLGEHKEKNTTVGFGLQLGAEYNLWMGALLAELQVAWSKLDHRVTGDANTGSLGINLGYRMMF